MDRKIWALFSVENNYDQIANNLVCFWFEKPDLKAISKVFKVPDMLGAHMFDAVEKYGDTLKKINLILEFPGSQQRINSADYRLQYRLQQITEAAPL